MLGLPLPLGLSLTLSYLALALVVSAAISLQRLQVPGIRRGRVLLWTGLGIGATSVTVRTLYFALA